MICNVCKSSEQIGASIIADGIQTSNSKRYLEDIQHYTWDKDKVVPCLIKHYIMKTYVGVALQYS
jgi:hypothetical protein